MFTVVASTKAGTVPTQNDPNFRGLDVKLNKYEGNLCGAKTADGQFAIGILSLCKILRL